MSPAGCFHYLPIVVLLVEHGVHIHLQNSVEAVSHIGDASDLLDLCP